MMLEVEYYQRSLSLFNLADTYNLYLYTLVKISTPTTTEISNENSKIDTANISNKSLPMTQTGNSNENPIENSTISTTESKQE